MREGRWLDVCRQQRLWFYFVFFDLTTNDVYSVVVLRDIIQEVDIRCPDATKLDDAL
jgi:hypothetical protein